MWRYTFLDLMHRRLRPRRTTIAQYIEQIEGHPYRWVMPAHYAGCSHCVLKIIPTNAFSLQANVQESVLVKLTGSTRNPQSPRQTTRVTGFDPDDDMPLSDAKQSPLRHILNAL